MSSELPSQLKVRMSAVELSILDYVLSLHASEAERNRAAFMTLLCHASLLSRGAKLTTSEEQPTPGVSSSILPTGWASGELIRLNYILHRPLPGLSGSSSLMPQVNKLQLSVAKSESHIYISLTDSTTDKFGHVEFTGPELVRLDAIFPADTSSSEAGKIACVRPLDISSVFPQLDSTLFEMEEKLWKPVLPAPSTPPSRLSTESGTRNAPASPLMGGRFTEPGNRYEPSVPVHSGPFYPEYGRSDLDPLGGFGRNPLGGIGIGGVGGMILDPNRSMPRGPPGLVPPGARYDPIGPPMIPGRGSGRGSRVNPDPDHAMLPGFEDMYM